jgi:non-ribosomal peptide synthetase-like protein
MKVPDGERWAGSAAQRADVDYVRVGPAHCGTLRRLGSSLLTLVLTFFVFVPLGLSGLRLLTNGIPQLAALLSPGTHKTESGTVIVHALVTSLVLFTGATLIGLLIVGVVPRVLNCFVKPDKVYPLYGIHHWLHRTISGLTNVKFFVHLFGESSYVVPYLRLIGYNLSEVVQTGANFGLDLKHENPYLVSVGSGTMVADGLSIINAEFSSTSFRVSRVSIGPRNFLGNNIVYPSGGRTGENCLLATKVMVPLDGEIREATGLLGSPSFEIPRSVERDSRFDHLRTGRTLRRNLARKNRYDLRTIGVFLFVRWLYTFLSTMLVLVAVDLFAEVAHLVSAALLSLTLVVTASYFAVVERCFTALRPLQPKSCSMYDPYFWWHERLWKVIADTHFAAFDGTPFKNILWRLLGVRLGKRVFDDGCFFSERTLVAVGDDSTLNHGSRVQCHSQEDGTFKSDYTTIGAGCTLGVGAHVHYGVTLGDGSVLAPDSFLMKGEEIPQHGLWGGNPAREIQNDQYQPA